MTTPPQTTTIHQSSSSLSSSTPQTHALAVSCRTLRSPSHESLTTDLSLFSVSTLASDAFGKQRLVTFKEHRGCSPNPDLKELHANRPADIPEIMWFEEGNDLIRSCAALSSALGMQRSFSTSDIAQLPSPDIQPNQLRPAVSELALNSLQRCGYMLENPRLEHASRSCSTWVAVGELASTSQLPSPHGGPVNPPQLSTNTPPPPAFTAADLIRSVNKKVRQNYIRRRLLTTYRALERLSQSEFNLDRLEAAAAAATANSGPGPIELVVPTTTVTAIGASVTDTTTATTVPLASTSEPAKPASIPISSGAGPKKQSTVTLIDCPQQLKSRISMNINKNLTIADIEKERGKPLSKYDRNMMIFNWLHTLDEVSPIEDVS